MRILEQRIFWISAFAGMKSIELLTQVEYIKIEKKE